MSARQHLLAALCASLAAAAPAATVNVGVATEQPGATASIPVTITGDADDLTLVILTVTQPAPLPVPVATAGPDQWNLPSMDVFVDTVAPYTHRVTALARSAPDMAAGGGHVVTLTYDLASVPVGDYPLAITAVELHNLANATTPVASALDGLVTVSTSAAVADWTVFE